MVQLTTGALIAGYRVDGLAGQGGMGVVYRATQLSLGRTVALKLIAPGLAGDQSFRERFERESRLAAAIDHPNVLPVYEAGDVDGTLFIAMRWVDGVDLRTLIHRGNGVEPRRAVRIVGQVAAGLDAAHRLGLVHRDVKPANILMPAGTEHAYLTDFGLMKRIRGGEELTDSGEFIGTIDYIAPEQIRGDGCDARSDVYSLGCVLFHSLVGRVPFDADTGVAKIYAHLNEEPSHPSELRTGLPRDLDEVVAQAMAKDPDDRYATAGDLARAAARATGQGPPPALGHATTTMAAGTAPVAERPVAAEEKSSHRDGGAWRGRRLLGPTLLVAATAAVALWALRGSDEAHPAQKHGPPPSFADGALLQTAGGARLYVVKAGARFRVPRGERAAFNVGGRPQEVSLRTVRRIPVVPREGALIRAYRASLVWRIHNGARELAEPPPGADIAIVPSSGLAQIPAPPGGRRTQVAITAPSFVVEHHRFVISAHVRSTSGIPTGICLVYRVSPGRRKERGNAPVEQGGCGVRLKVSGFDQVRYSVVFVGDPGWRSSRALTRSIVVVPSG